MAVSSAQLPDEKAKPQIIPIVDLVNQFIEAKAFDEKYYETYNTLFYRLGNLSETERSDLRTYVTKFLLPKFKEFPNTVNSSELIILSLIKGFDIEVTKDLDTQYRKLAAEHKPFNPVAAYRYGLLLQKNDPKTALHYFKQSESFPLSLIHLGEMYGDGLGVGKDQKQAMTYFDKAASSNNSWVLFTLGAIYEEGKHGCKQDYNKMLGYYFKSAKLNLPYAYYYLGICYESGPGVPQDHKKALENYTKAVSLGHAKSMISLGRYFLGRVTGNKKDLPAKNIKKAIELFQEAINRRSYEANFSLATLYRTEAAVKDEKKALEYYLNCVDFQIPSGIWDLGVLEKNLTKSAILMRLAFELNSNFDRTGLSTFANDSKDPVCDYHIGMALEDESILKRAIKTNPKQILQLLEKDLHPKNELEETNFAGIPLRPKGFNSALETLKQGVYETLKKINIKDLSDPQVIDQIHAELGLKEMENENPEGLSYFFNLNPANLSPRQNFEIGFYLMNHLLYQPESHTPLAKKLLSFTDRLRYDKTEISDTLFNIAYQHLRFAAQDFHPEAKQFLIRCCLEKSNISVEELRRLYEQPFSFPRNFHQFKIEVMKQLASNLSQQHDQKEDFQKLKSTLVASNNEKDYQTLKALAENKNIEAIKCLVDAFCERYTILNKEVKDFLLETYKTLSPLPNSFGEFKTLSRTLIGYQFDQKQLTEQREKEGLIGLMSIFNAPTATTSPKDQKLIKQCLDDIQTIFLPYQKKLISAIGMIALADAKSVIDPVGLSRQQLEEFPFLKQIQNSLDRYLSLDQSELKIEDLKNLKSAFEIKNSEDFKNLNSNFKKKFETDAEKIIQLIDKTITLIENPEIAKAPKKDSKKASK